MKFEKYEGRRAFLKNTAAAAAAAALPGLAEARPSADGLKWSMLVHFGMKWLGDIPQKRKGGKPTGSISSNLTQEEYDQICTPAYWELDHVRFDEGLWREYSERLRQNGCNEIVIDLCEFVEFPSHPELAVKGTWKVERMAAELERLRGMGFSVVPKLNFSCTHNGWMGEYLRRVSTPEYYRFCADVIRDTMRLFKGADAFHLGLDEESFKYQHDGTSSVMVVRSSDLWWHDVRFLCGEVEKNGARPWVWADCIRRLGNAFLDNVPKNAICSEWMYYGKKDEVNRNVLANYKKYCTTLEKGGYTQMITGSHCFGNSQGCFDQMRWALDALPAKRLRGFLMTTWMPVMPAYRRLLLKGADVIGEVRRACAAV